MEVSKTEFQMRNKDTDQTKSAQVEVWPIWSACELSASVHATMMASSKRNVGCAPVFRLQNSQKASINPAFRFHFWWITTTPERDYLRGVQIDDQKGVRACCASQLEPNLQDGNDLYPSGSWFPSAPQVGLNLWHYGRHAWFGPVCHFDVSDWVIQRRGSHPG